MVGAGVPCVLATHGVYVTEVTVAGSVDDVERRFEEAYETLWAPVFRFALARTNEWATAEDIAQEAFSRLWARRQAVDWQAPVIGWLLVTARHLATDRFRLLQRALRHSLLSQASLPASWDDDARLRWLDVQRALGNLSVEERAALTMVAVGGFDYEEAARILETSVGAVRAAVSRGRRKLDGLT